MKRILSFLSSQSWQDLFPVSHTISIPRFIILFEELKLSFYSDVNITGLVLLGMSGIWPNQNRHQHSSIDVNMCGWLLGRGWKVNDVEVAGSRWCGRARDEKMTWKGKISSFNKLEHTCPKVASPLDSNLRSGAAVGANRRGSWASIFGQYL